MTSLDLSAPGQAMRPPHVPAFSVPVRAGIAAVIALLGALALGLDWPFSIIGTLQPVLLSLGMALVSYVTDIPFQALWQRLGLIVFS